MNNKEQEAFALLLRTMKEYGIPPKLLRNPRIRKAVERHRDIIRAVWLRELGQAVAEGNADAAAKIAEGYVKRLRKIGMLPKGA
jgi:hypothetical protein